MIRHVHSILIGLLMLACGCAGKPEANSPTPGRVTIFVPGVMGDGVWYDGLREELQAGGRPVEVFAWGAPKILFFANYSDQKIHDDAERKLARRLSAIAPSGASVDLVGHSAGCGVILGALARDVSRADQVVLLAPSVSPGYDLRPALSHIQGRLQVFHSTRDMTFLKWRTDTFGTYDRIKTAAAGHGGFDVTLLDESARKKLLQHPYNDRWRSLGNDGGHAGPTARRFVREIVRPLLDQK